MSNIDKHALNEEQIEWLNKLADMEYCKSNPGNWLMSLKDTNMLAKLALSSVSLLDELEAAENNLIDSECHVAELEESLRDKQALLEAAEKRIAELEAREINLPPYSFFDFKQGSPFKHGAYCRLDAVNAELSKHGIKIVAAGIGKGE